MNGTTAVRCSLVHFFKETCPGHDFWLILSVNEHGLFFFDQSGLPEMSTHQAFALRALCVELLLRHMPSAFIPSNGQDTEIHIAVRRSGTGEEGVEITIEQHLQPKLLHTLTL